MRQDQVEALVEDIFSRLDTNQDGVVTIDEFIEACQRVRNHPYNTSEKGLVGWVLKMAIFAEAVFMLTLWLGGSEKGQKYADLFYGYLMAIWELSLMTSSVFWPFLTFWPYLVLLHNVPSFGLSWTPPTYPNMGRH